MSRKIILFAAIALVSLSARAEMYPSSFSIGPRISSFSTDIHGIAGDTSASSGRQTGFGIVGGYRNGRFVMDFSWDEDSSNGAQLTNLLVDVSDFRRDREEVAAGYALTPNVDLEAGIRNESYAVGGFSFFGTVGASDFDMDHQAFTAGVNLHSDPRQRVVFNVMVRGYAGTARYDNVIATDLHTSTAGWRTEGTATVHLGQSRWSIVPGVEFEHMTASDLQFNTNQIFVNVVWRTR